MRRESRVVTFCPWRKRGIQQDSELGVKTRFIAL
jgi:hypothetical protein